MNSGCSSHWAASLFSDQTMRARFSAEADLKRFLRIEAAWTRSLGVISNSQEAESVAQAIEDARVDVALLTTGFEADGVPIPALVKSLRHSLGTKAERWIHHGLTSQDVVDTALVLALGDALEDLAQRLGDLDKALERVHVQHGTSRVLSYTRMQPALDVPASEIIGRWRQPISKLLDDLETAKTALAIIQWGGPVGIREHEQAAALGAEFARQLGLSDPGQNWHTDRTPIMSALHVLGRISVVTGKIGEDLALMAAIGSHQVVLQGGGSSAMPHKVNPVKAEMLITLADRVAILQASGLRSARHESLRSGRAWMLEWPVLQEACGCTASSLTLASKLIADIQTLGH